VGPALPTGTAATHPASPRGEGIAGGAAESTRAFEGPLLARAVIVTHNGVASPRKLRQRAARAENEQGRARTGCPECRTDRPPLGVGARQPESLPARQAGLPQGDQAPARGTRPTEAPPAGREAAPRRRPELGRRRQDAPHRGRLLPRADRGDGRPGPRAPVAGLDDPPHPRTGGRRPSGPRCPLGEGRPAVLAAQRPRAAGPSRPRPAPGRGRAEAVRALRPRTAVGVLGGTVSAVGAVDRSGQQRPAPRLTKARPRGRHCDRGRSGGCREASDT
jgi:hypothetical protein